MRSQFATASGIDRESMKIAQPPLETDLVESLIRLIRGQRVILDADLAQVYGVPTKQLNQAIRRNIEKFPDDFAFELDPEELTNLRSQFVTSSGHGGRRYRPWAFTEHGAIMAANVLNSPRAVQMSVFVVRAFVKMRETLAQNKELATKLAELERNLTNGSTTTNKPSFISWARSRSSWNRFPLMRNPPRVRWDSMLRKNLLPTPSRSEERKNHDH